MERTVLVVDDSVTMRRIVGFTLKEAGFQVIESANGVEALRELKYQKVDLIIADVNMPVMDGISFVREARATAELKFVPILMLTTESVGSRVVEGREAGATGWMVKPFKPQKLLETIARVLG